MKRMAAIALLILVSRPANAFFDVGPLLQLVAGQIEELEKLSDSVGIARDQKALLLGINDGINRTVAQIQTLQSIVTRAQGLDPRQVRNLADLNDLLDRANDTRQQIEVILQSKIAIANQAIAESALQSDTSYKMGQEMVSVGAGLAQESQTASPGRAAQISAASGSAQMLSQGVQLQTLSQIVQLQALTLEFQKAQVEKDIQTDRIRRDMFQSQLGLATRKARP